MSKLVEVERVEEEITVSPEAPVSWTVEPVSGHHQALLTLIGHGNSTKIAVGLDQQSAAILIAQLALHVPGVMTLSRLEEFCKWRGLEIVRPEVPTPYVRIKASQ